MKGLSKRMEEKASRIHMEALVVDTHCDTLMKFMPQPKGSPPARRLGERADYGHIDLPRLTEGGVDCQTFAVYTGERINQPGATLRALQMIDIFYRECDANDGIAPVYSFEDILTTNKDDKIAALLAIEGGEPLQGDLGALRVFYRLGVRMLSFTWNWRTPFADGLDAKRAEGRLTDLGVAALEEMERLGMILDVSHISDGCFWDIADLKEGPFIASHSNCRDICDHSRNLTDDMITSLAEHGGVMGMNFAPSFVHEEEATVKRLVDHIDHVVDLVGPEHVGLGSDFDGIGSTPVGLEDVTKMLNITRELVRREYSDDDILKILGGNYLRVFKETL